MVRRRMASPKPSSPIHRRPSSPMSARSPNTVPVQAHPPSAPHGMPSARFGAVPPPSQGPGLMGQMAATAGGVAIGSAVGHAVGSMITGGRNEAVPVEMQDQKEQQMRQQQYKNPCEFEWKQFIECAETQNDISLCQSFNEIFKECRANKYA